MKYTTILFDADGTLYDFDKAALEALKSSFEKYKLEWEDDIFERYEIVNKKIWEEFEKGLLTPSQIKTERFKIFFSQNKINNVNPDEFSMDYLTFLSQNNFLFPYAEDIVKWCSENFDLALVTNGLAYVQNSRFKNSSLRKYFKHIVISEEIGAAKPHKEIFRHTFNLLNQKTKENVIIIGDNLNSDIKGGINFGIDTCWINPSGKENASEIKPTFTIKKLDELKNILK